YRRDGCWRQERRQIPRCWKTVGRRHTHLRTEPSVGAGGDERVRGERPLLDVRLQLEAVLEHRAHQGRKLRVRDRVAGRNGRDDGELRRLSPIRKSNELRWQRQDAVRLKREAKQGEGGVAGTPEPAGVERAERGRLREPERRRSSYY